MFLYKTKAIELPYVHDLLINWSHPSQHLGHLVRGVPQGQGETVVGSSVPSHGHDVGFVQLVVAEPGAVGFGGFHSPEPSTFPVAAVVPVQHKKYSLGLDL